MISHIIGQMEYELEGQSEKGKARGRLECGGCEDGPQNEDVREEKLAASQCGWGGRLLPSTPGLLSSPQHHYTKALTPLERSAHTCVHMCWDETRKWVRGRGPFYLVLAKKSRRDHGTADHVFI